MVAAAKLAFDLALPTEVAGTNVLTLPDREVTWVRRKFEKAVGGFYDVVLQPQGWRVRCGGTLSWQIELKTSGIDKILPTMRTDVVLDHAPSGRRIVIDTKFTSIITSGWYRDETLRSGYVYQIYIREVALGFGLHDRRPSRKVIIGPSNWLITLIYPHQCVSQGFTAQRILDRAIAPAQRRYCRNSGRRVAGLKRIYRDGFKLAKAGVMLLDLQSDTAQQYELDLQDDQEPDRGSLMSLMATQIPPLVDCGRNVHY